MPFPFWKIHRTVKSCTFSLICVCDRCFRSKTFPNTWFYKTIIPAKNTREHQIRENMSYFGVPHYVECTMFGCSTICFLGQALHISSMACLPDLAIHSSSFVSRRKWKLQESTILLHISSLLKWIHNESPLKNDALVSIFSLGKLHSFLLTYVFANSHTF